MPPPQRNVKNLILGESFFPANKPNKIDSLKPDVVVQHIFLPTGFISQKNTLQKTVRTWKSWVFNIGILIMMNGLL